MAIAKSLKTFLGKRGVSYESIPHHHSDSSYNSAAAAHIPSQQMAKAVLLGDTDQRHIMAVLPANRHLVLKAINDMTCGNFKLLDEAEIARLFSDCEAGAAPALGNSYAMEMIVDRELLLEPTVYIEAGDHDHLLKFEHEDYQDLVMSSRDATISGEIIGNRLTPQINCAVFA